LAVASTVSRRDCDDIEDDDDARTKLAMRGSQGKYEIKVFGDCFVIFDSANGAPH
jgi:hypothetical protein